MLRKISLVIIIALIIVMGALRFWKLDAIPYGYHVDEVAGAVTMQCMTTQGCDAQLHPWPLFGSIEYGTDKPPTYIYPALLWSKYFGTTVPSLRTFGVLGITIGLIGLFFLGRAVGGFNCGVIAVLTASCSPWMWVMSRVLLESYFAPVYVIWGLYFFWRSNRWWDWAIAGLMFAFAIYTYPPARMQVPLMILSLGVYEWGRRSLRWTSILSFLALLILPLLPLLKGYLHGGLARRFNDISILNQNFLHSIGVTGTHQQILSIFIHNYLLHLSPKFLFFTGDPSFVHSTGHLGILSFLDMAALFILFIFFCLFLFKRSWKDNPCLKERRWILFLLANILLGIIPSALTNQELPHALRICGSWPFMMLLTGSVLAWITQWIKISWPIIVLVGALSCGVLTYQYFVIYPQQSKGMFDYWIKESAEQCKTKEDEEKFIFVFRRQNYHCRYFMVQRMGLTCKQANDLWTQMFYYLISKGMF